MARRNDLIREVAKAASESDEVGRVRRERQQARRAEALSLRLAGLSYDQIGERLKIDGAGARDLIVRTLRQAESRGVEQLRELENARLDRAQAAIWAQVLQGDIKAVQTFISISARRAKMNGLDEATKVSLSVAVRTEMEMALVQLENMVLGDTKMLEGAVQQIEQIERFDSEERDDLALDREMSTDMGADTHEDRG